MLQTALALMVFTIGAVGYSGWWTERRPKRSLPLVNPKVLLVVLGMAFMLVFLWY